METDRFSDYFFIKIITLTEIVYKYTKNTVDWYKK
jgi:hypothetical protein